MLYHLPLLWTLICALAGAATPPEPIELEAAIAGHLMDVAEFRYLREEAKKLNVRVWLFGGTAAGYAHYANWDLLRKKGDTRFQPDRFDYDYTDIYRSTQDLDIVVDGPSSAARTLENLLHRRYPYASGSKSQWEVRLLRKALGDKDALLGNPDFLDQHTDSNSTGMVEISEPPAGEAVVRDLRDWNARWPHFFEDIRLGQLHYYFSERHASTSRYRSGMNPPILSAIRYLTKAFQYELALSPADLEKIRAVIKAFPNNESRHPYVADWIERNGKN